MSGKDMDIPIPSGSNSAKNGCHLDSEWSATSSLDGLTSVAAPPIVAPDFSHPKLEDGSGSLLDVSLSADQFSGSSPEQMQCVVERLLEENRGLKMVVDTQKLRIETLQGENKLLRQPVKIEMDAGRTLAHSADPMMASPTGSVRMGGPPPPPPGAPAPGGPAARGGGPPPPPPPRVVSKERVVNALQSMESSVVQLEVLMSTSITKHMMSSDDKFVAVMGPFAKNAREQCGLMQSRYAAMKSRYKELASFYCFDFNYPIGAFFGNMQKFLLDFQKAQQESQNALFGVKGNNAPKGRPKRLGPVELSVVETNSEPRGQVTKNKAPKGRPKRLGALVFDELESKPEPPEPLSKKAKSKNVVSSERERCGGGHVR